MARASSPPSKSNPTSTSPQPAETTTVRLHIVPLTPSTAASLLPASILTPAACATISYHTLPTFPEHPYAFVTLPVSAADALKKKLHGSTFRGVKVRVEEARPQKSPPSPEEGMKDDVEKTKKELRAERREKRKREEGEGKVKKRKKGETKDVLEGVELPEGRKVARGWTSAETPTSKKYAGRSSSTISAAKEDTKRECLFKTPLPPNKVSTKESKKKDKEEKEGKKEKKEKKENKRNKEVIVKEFKNNTKFPAFLKSSQLGERMAEEMASEYVDGVGWVNGRGEVVEGENRKRRAADVVQVESAKITNTVVAETSEIIPKPVDKYRGTVSFEDANEAMVDAGSKKETASKYVSDDSSSEPEPESNSEKSPAAVKATPVSDLEFSGEESNESEAGSESKDLPTKTKKTNPTPSSDSESSDEGSSELDTKLKPSTKSSAGIFFNPVSDSDSDSDSSNKEESDPESIKTPTKAKPPRTALLTPTTPVSLLIRTVTSSSAPKNSTPTLQITIPPSAKVHPLEALYKPTATSLYTGAAASSASSGGFKFSFGAAADDNDDDDDPEDASPVVATPYRERYRSAAPTPDTAIGHRRFFPDDNDHGTRLSFVPSTPHVVGGGGLPGGQDSTSRGTSAAVESPLLFLHPESRFLGALSVWSQLPTPKAFVPDEPTAEEAGEKKDKKGKKGKRGAEEMEQEEEEKGVMTPAEVWSERFYEKRGEWNRAWKGRRREVLKAKRKREGGGKGPHA